MALVGVARITTARQREKINGTQRKPPIPFPKTRIPPITKIGDKVDGGEDAVERAGETSVAEATTIPDVAI